MATYTHRVLSLCSGIGGLDLAVQTATRSRTICYVERESFAASLLVERMEKKELDHAPIWDDLTTFDGQPWRGIVDLIVAGFPCQPVSQAGKRKGQEDERWIWDDIVRIIREVQPRFVFLENVTGILSLGLGGVLGDLALLGFDAEWLVLRASDVGAPHQRKRWFCLAYSSGGGDKRWGRPEDVVRPQGAVEDNRQQRERGRGAFDGCGSIFPPGPDDRSGWREFLKQYPKTEPAVCRNADGLSGRVDRLRGLGNAVVPLQAAVALRVLADRAGLSL